MKYQELTQIANYFQKYKNINYIKRIEDSILELCLDDDRYIFDMNRAKSSIYKKDLLINKNYNATFDISLKKYFNNAKIKDIKILKNNRIMRFSALATKSYKAYLSYIYFEFTGKNTNVIISDENDIILAALRYINKSYRIIKIGEKLIELNPYKMDENIELIVDFEEYFSQKAKIIYDNKFKENQKNKLNHINKKINTLKNNLNNLEKEEKLYQIAKDYALKADVLYANLNSLKPYEYNFSLDDFEGNKIYFDLNDTPLKSANDFYKLAKKYKQKASNIKIQKSNLNEKLEFLNNLNNLIKNSKNINELDILVPKKNNKEKKEEENKNIAYFDMQDCKIFLGKNEKANEILLKSSSKKDLWMHVKDYPSPHVIIKSNKANISKEVLEYAAYLCVYFANLSSGSYLVDYTYKNFVKIKQKAFVNYTNYKSLSITKE